MSAQPVTVIVASTNPTKVNAAEQGFAQLFPSTTYTVRGISVPSGVPDQPISDAQTLQGAKNRVSNAQAAEPDADYWVGIEGGVEIEGEHNDGPIQSFAWIVITGASGGVGKSGKDGHKTTTSKVRTSTFYLPEETAKLIRGGMELGHADDALHSRSNSKQQGGSVGLLTDNVITRTSYYVPNVVLALIPFKNTNLTFP